MKIKINPINIDLSKADYQIDALQNEILNFYLRADRKFLRAFNTDWTPHFLKYLQDKARLKEPAHLSGMGGVRCQPKGSKVLMSNGIWKNIEEIKIGDEILSPQKDGSNIFAKIKGISSHQSNKRYNLFQKNRKRKYLYSCSKNHIIPLFHHKVYKKNPRKEWEINNYNVEDLLKYSSQAFLSNKIGFSSFPISKFKERKNCKIEPYSLGIFLGDGHYTQSIGITTENNKIIDKIREHYKFMNVQIKKGTQTKTYLFSRNSKFARLLEKYGLKNKKSKNKFIPKEALLSDISYRRRLLAGLIDSDGHLSKELAYSITSKSKQLIEDIAFLVHSLGGRTYITKVSKIIKNINFKGSYYRVSFYLGNLIYNIPILLKTKRRKKNKGFTYLEPNRIAIRIKKQKKKEIMYGFEVDSPSKWYITNNFMVTHNSGKSYSFISVAGYLMALYNKILTIDYICENAFEFLEAIKQMPMEKVKNSCFLIDEDKQTIYGIGSVAKKMKLTDVQNIIAIQNVSTISINPHTWANKKADYGLRSFGRCFKTKTCRFMLYNLQEHGRGGELPLGLVFLPIFTELLPYGKELEKKYLNKKQSWVEREQKGEGDVLYELKMNSARSFLKDHKFTELTKKAEKMTYISVKLGSEWTKTECEEIYNLTNLLEDGAI